MFFWWNWEYIEASVLVKGEFFTGVIPASWDNPGDCFS